MELYQSDEKTSELLNNFFEHVILYAMFNIPYGISDFLVLLIIYHIVFGCSLG